MNNNFDKLSKYSFWNGKKPEAGILRKGYISRMQGYIGNKLIKILLGGRCVGKSYLLRQIALHLIDEGVSCRNILYINKVFTDSGLVDNKALEDLLQTYREKLHPVGKIYIFIEEIQNVEGWEQFVFAHSQDYVDSCELFISGSSARMLSGESATLLAGHYVSFEVFPLDYQEYIEMNREESGRQSFMEYLSSGFLPGFIALPGEEMRWQYVSALKDTVLLRDIIQHYRIKDARLLDDCFAYLACNLSGLVSITNLVGYFTAQKRKTSYDTLSNYLCYLEDSFLIHRMERYQIKTRELVLGSCRYYLNDLSFRSLLYPCFNSNLKANLENAVYLDLKRAGYRVYVGTIRNSLVDFVACKGDRIIYIQSAITLYDDQIARQTYAPLELIQDNYEKYVVSPDSVALPSKDGIRHILAWKLADIIK